MQVQYNIFNQKRLQNKINRNDFRISNFEDANSTISKWRHIIENGTLKSTTETSIKGAFLTQFFIEILGYKDVTSDDNEWTIEIEQSTLIDNSKPDAILGYFTRKKKDARVVVELKNVNIDLDAKQKSRKSQLTPVEQAFNYSHKYGIECRWIIVSNFVETRLYHSSSSLKYERFLTTELLDTENLFKFYYLLNSLNLINKHENSTVDYLFLSNEEEQTQITNKFYQDYTQLRTLIVKNLIANNSISDKMELLEKAQKILDRIIFIRFCEESGLLPPNTLMNTIDISKKSYNTSQEKIWISLKQLFNAIDKGNPPMNIHRFNGGLFKEDKILNSLYIPDEALYNLEKLAKYDFSSDIDVNILSHIFEQSISDLEIIKHAIRDNINVESNLKKETGIYYTPEFITRFIVEMTIGKWLECIRGNLGEANLPTDDLINKNGKLPNKVAGKYINFWIQYQKALSSIKVLDLACGSGAFLNQAFDFLYKEVKVINNTINKLINPSKQKNTAIFKHILNENLFGVDINSESVEITKLSLWLKTANKYSTLTSLDDNIKCGNSIVNN